MNIENKAKCYRVAFQVFQKNPLVQNLSYPKEKKDLIFNCNIGVFEVRYILKVKADLLILRAEVEFPRKPDEEIMKIAESYMKDEKRVRFTAFDEKMIIQTSVPYPNIADEDAEVMLLENTEYFLSFICDESKLEYLEKQGAKNNNKSKKILDTNKADKTEGLSTNEQEGTLCKTDNDIEDVKKSEEIEERATSLFLDLEKECNQNDVLVTNKRTEIQTEQEGKKEELQKKNTVNYTAEKNKEVRGCKDTGENGIKKNEKNSDEKEIGLRKENHEKSLPNNSFSKSRNKSKTLSDQAVDTNFFMEEYEVVKPKEDQDKREVEFKESKEIRNKIVQNEAEKQKASEYTLQTSINDEDKIEALTKENRELKSKIQKMLDEYEQRFSDIDENNKKSRKKLEETIANLMKANNENLEIREKIKELEVEKKSCENELVKVKKECEMLHEANNNNKDKERISELESSKRSLLSDRESLKNVICELEKEIEEMKKNHQDQKTKENNLYNVLEEKNNAIEQLNEQIVELKKSNEELRNEDSKKNKLINEQESDLYRLRKKEDELTRLEAQCKTLEEQVQKDQLRTMKSDDVLMSREQEIERMRVALETSKTTLLTTMQEKDELANELIQSKAEISNIKMELQSTKLHMSDYEKIKEEKNKLKIKCDNFYDVDKEAIVKENEIIKSENEELIRKQQQLSWEIENIRSEMNIKQKKIIDECNESLNAMKGKVSVQNSEKKELEEKLQCREAEYEKLFKETELLRTCDYRETLKNRGITASVIVGKTPNTYAAEFNNCKILIDGTNHVLMIQKQIKAFSRCQKIIKQWNDENITESYLIEGKLLTCKKTMSNNIVADIEAVTERMAQIK